MFEQFVDQFVNPLLHLILTALATAAVGVVVRYLQKLGLTIDAQRYHKLQEIANSAVLLAEERVADALKRTGAPAVGAGAEKMELAITAIVDKVPNISRPEAEALAKEAVARVGLGATDLLGKAAAAAKS